MRPDLLEGVRTLRWSGLHPSHASGITDTLTEVSWTGPLASTEVCEVIVTGPDPDWLVASAAD
jgi:hypothetical protein